MGDTLDRDDIFLMMKSYENNIKFNTQLIEKQDILIKEQIKTVETIKSITLEQQKLNIQLEALIESGSSHNASSSASVTDIFKSVTDGRILSVKEHSLLRYHLVGISGGLLVVIIALITAYEKLWSKSDIIDAVAKFIGVTQ